MIRTGRLPPLAVAARLAARRRQGGRSAAEPALDLAWLEAQERALAAWRDAAEEMDDREQATRLEAHRAWLAGEIARLRSEPGRTGPAT